MSDRILTLNDYRADAKPLFLAAVDTAIREPSREGPLELSRLHDMAHTCFNTLAAAERTSCGIRCPLDAFGAIVPHDTTGLTLHAWSQLRTTIGGFDVLLRLRAFALMPWHAHLEIRHFQSGPLPFSPTGYQSLYPNLAELAEYPDLLDYVREIFYNHRTPAAIAATCRAAPAPQLALF